MWEISRRGQVPGPVRLVAALVVALGILGMHALAHHGTTHQSSAAQSSAASAGATAPAHHDVAGNAHHEAPATAADLTPSGLAGGADHALDDMVMLCAAMLAAAGTVLALLAAVRRSPRLWALLPPTVARVRPVRHLARVDSGPPPEWRFSVVRC